MFFPKGNILASFKDLGMIRPAKSGGTKSDNSGRSSSPHKKGLKALSGPELLNKKVFRKSAKHWTDSSIRLIKVFTLKSTKTRRSWLETKTDRVSVCTPKANV